MRIITSKESLEAFIDEARQHPFVTLDTEFLRERTYYAQLCLIQIAYPGTEENSAAIVDPLAETMDLSPLFELFRDPGIVKVFHAARQDLEIFWQLGKCFPTPLFDTQIAAMVCGFGDQVGYETLVRKIAKASLDKSSRFTDWSVRPLSTRQLNYAIADVTHLRDIYLQLSHQLTTSGRAPWVEEELQTLTKPETYETTPEDAWKRIKTRASGAKFSSAVRTLAAFRESYAQKNNIPRNRVFKDDALLEMASNRPKDLQALSRSRLLLREARKGSIAEGIIQAIEAAEKLPTEKNASEERDPQLQVDPALADLLRVLLKAKADSSGVAQKLIASSAEIDSIAAGLRDLPSLSGWRREVFGEDALRLCEGEIALGAHNRKLVLVKKG